MASYLTSRNASKANELSATEKAIQAQQLKNLQGFSPYALDFLKRGSQQLGQAQSYNDQILRGGRSNVLAMLGPEMAAGARGDNAALAASMRLMGPGGGSADARMQYMDSRSRERNNALLSMRPTAAQMAAGMGGQFSNLGGSLFGQSMQGGQGILNFNQDQRRQSFDMGRQAGNSAYNMFSGFGNLYQPNTQQPQQQQIPASSYPGAFGGMMRTSQGVRP